MKASFVEPMECLSVPRLPEGWQWLWEIKLDGYRALGLKSGSDVTLPSIPDVARKLHKSRFSRGGLANLAQQLLSYRDGYCFSFFGLLTCSDVLGALRAAAQPQINSTSRFESLALR